MNDFDLALKEAKSSLMSEEIVQEYLRLKNIIENDSYLTSLEKEIRFHQKEMCKFVNDDDNYFLEKEKYQNLLNEYNENPLIKNFNNLKEEVYYLLKEVKDTLK